MIKKGIAMILLMVLALNVSFAASPVSGAFLDDQLYFKLGGKAVVPVGSDGKTVLPLSYNGTTYLPLRAIGTMLGLNIDYDGASKTIAMTKAGPSKVWRLKNTVFKDATNTTESYLMGTTSLMVDEIYFEGSGTSLIITHDRFDKASGKGLAGVTYEVNWTAPPEYLLPGEKYSIEHSVKTINSMTWTSGQQSIYLNQGWGVYFASASGVKFIGPDSSDTYTLEQAVTAGGKGQVRTIQINHAKGFVTTYEYEWID